MTPTDTLTPAALRNRAFNAGSDYRLAGLPVSDNPYADDPVLSPSFVAGWRSVNDSWGKDARRWPIMKLPAVTEEKVA